MATVRFIRSEKHEGVIWYESARRLWKGKPEKCFYLEYWQEGKKERVKYGWESQGKTERAAANERGARLKAISDGTSGPRKKQNPTIGDLWEAWSAWARTNRKSFGDDEGRYRLHIEPALAGVRMGQLRKQAVEEFKSGLLEKDISVQTAKHVLGLLKSIIYKAMEFDLWAGAHPMKGVAMPTVENERERFLSKREAGALLEALCIASDDVHDMSLLSYHTGMRFSEVAALTWERIHLEARTILVFAPQKKGQRRKSKPRSAYITDECLRMFKRRGVLDRGLVFTAEDGGQVSQISKSHSRAVETVGLNKGVTDERHKTTFHTWRHTFASEMAKSGKVTLHQLMELMGHQNIEMTLRYAHLIPGHAKEAVADVFNVHRP